MAKGKKTGGRNFKPGNKFGKGSVRTPEIIKKHRIKNREDIFLKLEHWWRTLTVKELRKELVKNQDILTSEDIAFLKQIELARMGDEKGMKFIGEWIYKAFPKPITIKPHISDDPSDDDAQFNITITNNTPKCDL